MIELRIKELRLTVTLIFGFVVALILSQHHGN